MRLHLISATRSFQTTRTLRASLVLVCLAFATSAFTCEDSDSSSSSDAGDSDVQEDPGNSDSLAVIEVPRPEELDDYVKDEAAAIVLGKALFWDLQTGGDGRTACATCHFHAGVDSRVLNTVNPGRDGVFQIVSGPDETLTAAVFPFGGDPSIDDIVGSQGVVSVDFLDLDLGSSMAEDGCVEAPDPIFHPARQVTGRNAPNMIMAIFNRDNFWDGRANRKFNGVNPSGDDDPDARIFVDDGDGIEREKVRLKPASQASQEVGPPNNEVEMSCKGRTWPELGRKLLSYTPLGTQIVDPTTATEPGDSVLGVWSAFPAEGLTTSYRELIEDAFHERFWDSDETVTLPASNGATNAEFSLMEANFALFWGLSIQAWASLLIPDQTPVDAFWEGTGSLSDQEQLGLDLFDGEARCGQCHGGAEFTNASIQNGGNGDAFANSAVRPIEEDAGREKGEFKTPTLRNVELSGPFFHNGGYLTLRQVVEFYNRGGDFPTLTTDSQVRELDLNDEEMDALVAFMLALTDERVRCEQAPFDHPSIVVENGPTLGAVGAGGLPAKGRPCLTPFLSDGDPNFHFRD